MSATKMSTTNKQVEKKTEVEQLIIQTVPIGSVKLWKDNPKKYDVESVKIVAEMIKSHGLNSPIVVWKKNNVIYKGNKSYRALSLLGLKEIPVVFKDFPSEQAAIAYGIDDNKASLLTGWDYNVLKKLMSSDNKEKETYIGFSEKEFKFIKSFDASIEVVPLMDKALKAFKILNTQNSSINIIKYACVRKNKLLMSNLDIFVEIPIESADGIFNLLNYQQLNDLSKCKIDVPITDFPEFQMYKKDNKV